jgi:hypothetical protein
MNDHTSDNEQPAKPLLKIFDGVIKMLPNENDNLILIGTLTADPTSTRSWARIEREVQGKGFEPLNHYDKAMNIT